MGLAKQSSVGSNSDPAKRTLVMVTVIPLHLRYTTANLSGLDIAKRTRWLKDVLTKTGLTQMMVGSADISWEHRHNKDYYQLHWHLATWTKDPENFRDDCYAGFRPRTNTTGP